MGYRGVAGECARVYLYPYFARYRLARTSLSRPRPRLSVSDAAIPPSKQAIRGTVCFTQAAWAGCC